MKARADRWEEEVILLDEEMRRVLQFCEWKQAWWQTQQTRQVLDEPHNKTLGEGLMAYSEEQIAMERAIAQTW